jgi:hypothetical protein
MGKPSVGEGWSPNSDKQLYVRHGGMLRYLHEIHLITNQIFHPTLDKQIYVRNGGIIRYRYLLATRNNAASV